MSSSTVPLHTDSWGYRTGTWGGCSPGATTCSTAWGQMPHPVIESPECNCTCISCMTNQRAVSSDHGQRILRINVPRSEVVHLCEGLYRTRRLCSIHRHASYTVRAEGNPQTFVKSRSNALSGVCSQSNWCASLVASSTTKHLGCKCLAYGSRLCHLEVIQSKFKIQKARIKIYT